jgi:hypothetical protein
VASHLSTDARLDLAYEWIHLLIAENKRLHTSLGLVDRLLGDVLANCSFELYQANLDAVINDLGDLGDFLIAHAPKIKALADRTP